MTEKLNKVTSKFEEVKSLENSNQTQINIYSNYLLSKDLLNQINLEEGEQSENVKSSNENNNCKPNYFPNCVFNYENNIHQDSENINHENIESSDDNDDDEELIFEDFENDFNFNFFKEESNKTENSSTKYNNITKNNNIGCFYFEEKENKEKNKEELYNNTNIKEGNNIPRVLSGPLNPTSYFHGEFSPVKESYKTTDSSSNFNIKSYMEPPNVNINNFYNKYDTNPNQNQNQFLFYNNSFNMNGRSGWICPDCKNFNYESKLGHLFIL